LKKEAIGRTFVKNAVIDPCAFLSSSFRATRPDRLILPEAIDLSPFNSARSFVLVFGGRIQGWPEKRKRRKENDEKTQIER
jgi:hypothetical protein